MGNTVFRFGHFRLDPQARELIEDEQRIGLPLSTIDCLIYLIQHRDRPVGRDELAAAVWGRVDVSEVSLTHSIMRLRRVLGDTGSEQRMIRTVPRLGYRWVLEGTSEEAVDGTVSARGVDAAESVLAEPKRDTPRRSRFFFAVAAVAAVAIALATFAWNRSSHREVRETSATPLPAIVIPASIDAPADAGWVRLGLMDLVATRLRRGGITTAPSETVVALVNARANEREAAAWPATLVVQPTATFAREEWDVRLEAQSGERTLRVEVRAGDPMKAGRNAADELLIKLGRTPPSDDDDASLAQETLRQRVSAAVLSGQLDVARSLVRAAPPALQATPEIALGEAKVEFFAGNYDTSRRQVETVLANLPASAAPALRARALNTLGAAYFRLGRIDDADRAYAEAIRLVADGGDANVLAKSYIGSGGVASQRMQLERAAADYGRARTLLDMSNDAFGVAAVDLNLGMNALQRGQPASALPILLSASKRFEQLAAEDALAATRIAIVDADLAVLDYPAALAASDRFESLDTGNQRQRWELVLARAQALTGAGRLADADTLLARIADASDREQDAIVRAQANGLAAELALARGDCAKAVELSTAAAATTTERITAAERAKTWRSLVHALQCSGQTAAAAEKIAAMQGSAAASDDAVAVQLALATADQAAAEGHRDLALQGYAAAMQIASRRSVPDDLVAVGLPYIRSLIAAGRLDEAASINGRIAPWADRDARAAAAEALVYAALKKTAAADAALERAHRLAGERMLTDVGATPR